MTINNNNRSNNACCFCCSSTVVASSTTTTTSKARWTRLCIFLALPTLICAPVPPASSSSSDDSSDGLHYYLRHAIRPRLHENSNDLVAPPPPPPPRGGTSSLLTSLVAYLEGVNLFPHHREEEQFTIGHDGDDGGDDAAADGDEIIDETTAAVVHERRKRRLHAEGSAMEGGNWYVDWFQGHCVQSCEPSTTSTSTSTTHNPHCGGIARWDQHLFDSAQDCCRGVLNWMPEADCTATGTPDGMMSALSSQEEEGDPESSTTSNAGGGGNGCPPEYSNLNTYVSFDEATIYIPPTFIDGHVYQCKDGPLSQYCNVFPPDWRRENPGDVIHTASEELGWTLLGDCDGNEVMGALQGDLEDEEEEEEGGLDGGSLLPGDNGLGLGPGGLLSPSSAANNGPGTGSGLSPSSAANNDPSSSSLSNAGSGLGDGTGSGLGSAANAPSSSSSFSKPTGGRPNGNRPTRPNRPNRPPTKPSLASQLTGGGAGLGSIGGDPSSPSSSSGGSSGASTGTRPIRPNNRPTTTTNSNKNPDPIKVQQLGNPTNPDDIDTETWAEYYEDMQPGFRDEDGDLNDVGLSSKPAPQALSSSLSSSLIEQNGVYCWRSGTVCESDADDFACCTACIHGTCI